MTKAVLSVLLLLIYTSSGAQNYNLVRAGKVQYYANSNHYIRASRVDSITVSGADTTYHLFATPRGNYITNPTLDKEGGSWLGKTIIAQADGTVLIPGYSGDTVRLNTQTKPGDKWVFYDNGNYIAEATVTGIDTMSIAGIIDSIRTIALTTNDTTDILHNVRIIISKHNGIIQTPDLYLFPQNKAGTDYFFDEATNHNPDKQNIIFKLTDFENPDILDIYDYDTGNIFLSQTTIGIQGIVQPPSFNLEKIIEKNVGPGHINYTVWSWRQIYYPPALGGYYTTGYKETFKYSSSTLYNTDYLPEEYGAKQLFFQDPADTMYCTQGAYMTQSNLLLYGAGGVQVITTEPNVTTTKYKKGLGMVYRNDYRGSGGGATDEYIKTAVYKGFPCGSFPTLSVNRYLPQEPKIQVYPNPADDMLYIKLPEQGAYQITVTNTLGQILKTKEKVQDKAEINIQDLPNGIYQLTVRNDEAGRKTQQQISIHH